MILMDDPAEKRRIYLKNSGTARQETQLHTQAIVSVNGASSKFGLDSIDNPN